MAVFLQHGLASFTERMTIDKMNCHGMTFLPLILDIRMLKIPIEKKFN